MPDDYASDGHDRVVAVVGKVLGCGGSRVISPDDDLHDLGMTSLNMVNLMLAIEAEFRFTVPKSDLHPDNFKSVRAIDRLVSRLLAA